MTVHLHQAAEVLIQAHQEEMMPTHQDQMNTGAAEFMIQVHLQDLLIPVLQEVVVGIQGLQAADHPAHIREDMIPAHQEVVVVGLQDLQAEVLHRIHLHQDIQVHQDLQVEPVAVAEVLKDVEYNR